MAVSSAARSVVTRDCAFLALATVAPPMTSPASKTMMLMTSRSSIRVKPFRVSDFRFWTVEKMFMAVKRGLSFAKFLFHAFAEPLLELALVIQVTGTGHAFDAGEHRRVHAQGDGDRFGSLAADGCS